MPRDITRGRGPRSGRVVGGTREHVLMETVSCERGGIGRHIEGVRALSNFEVTETIPNQPE